jgi:type II secretory pathway component PulM
MIKRPQRPNNLLEKISAFGQEIKALLTKDYSLEDLRNFPNTLTNTLKDWWNQAASGASRSSQAQANGLNADQDSQSTQNTVLRTPSGGFDLAQLVPTLLRFIQRQRKALVIALLIAVIWIAYLYLLAPFSERVQEQLEMRPAQWSQLQSLIRISKTSAAGTTGMPTTVSSLDDQEIQKILNVLTARGVKPSVFRLTADNPPRIEFQASDLMFSVWLDVLEELRTNWRLYPTQLSVVANDAGGGGAGMINASGVLTQYGINTVQTGASQ